MPKTRKARRGSGLPILSRLFYPVGAMISATGKSARNVSHGIGNIAGKTVNTVGRVGSRFAKAGNNSIRKLTQRKSRKASRKANKRH